MFSITYVTQDLCSLRTVCSLVCSYVSQYICSSVHMFPWTYFPKYLYSLVPMFSGTYVSKYLLCVSRPIFPITYVLPSSSVPPGTYVPQDQCSSVFVSPTCTPLPMFPMTCSMFLSTYVSWDLRSLRSMFPMTFVLWDRCSSVPMFPGPYTPWKLCTSLIIFPMTHVARNLCSSVSMFSLG